MTIFAAFEPSSAMNFFAPAARASASPAAVPPVKVKHRLRRAPQEQRWRAVAEHDIEQSRRQAGPATTSASATATRARRMRLDDDGIALTRAGPTFCSSRFAGALKGVTAPTTPYGMRRVNPKAPRRRRPNRAAVLRLSATSISAAHARSNWSRAMLRRSRSGSACRCPDDHLGDPFCIRLQRWQPPEAAPARVATVAVRKPRNARAHRAPRNPRRQESDNPARARSPASGDCRRTGSPPPRADSPWM